MDLLKENFCHDDVFQDIDAPLAYQAESARSR